MTITELLQETRDLCDADTTSYPTTGLLRRVNSAIETLVSNIIQVCRDFPFDDENFANITQGTITLEEGVSKYTITDRFLTILEVKVKDTGGVWSIVEPVVQAEDDDIVETGEASTGLPDKYRIVGRTIFLRPAPTSGSVTLTAGLKLSYTRTSYQITSDDVTTGTLIPGIATPWHITIAKMAALPYCKLYKKDRVPQLERDIYTETQECIKFYSDRLKDKRHRLAPKNESNK